MSNPVKNQLFRLIKSMTKAEKRNFKLYATRSRANTESKFIQLFDLIDRATEPDDDLTRTRLDLSAGQLSNLKRHLYAQCLTSLRLIYINKEIDIELRELIDFSHILYGKGLYLDALRGLDRAKALAVKNNRDLLHLEILEFQKLIESRHITLSRQVENKMEFLVHESAKRSFNVLNTSELFNMNIQIHGRYIEHGHSRSPEEAEENRKFYRSIQARRIDREVVAVTFQQKINRFQSTMWYQYIQLDFEEALSAATQANSTFDLERQETVKDPDLYMRTLYYVHIFCYLTGDRHRMARYSTRLATFLSDNKTQLNPNSQNIGHTYHSLTELNVLLSARDYAGAHTRGAAIRREVEAPDYEPTESRWCLLLYKFAAAAYALGHYEEALDHLIDILNRRSSLLREDLIINSRLLEALCHYELGNISVVDYHLTNLTRYLRKSKASARVHRLLVTVLSKLLYALPGEKDGLFTELLDGIEELSTDPFEHKALLYFDAREWVRLRQLPDTT